MIIRKKNHHKTFGKLELLGSIDVTDIVNILNNNPSLWGKNTARQESFSVHKNTQNIIIIWSEFKDDKIEFQRDDEMYNLFEPFIKKIQDILNDKLNIKKPKIYKLIFAKLLKNSKVRKHVDEGILLRVPNRIHIPIITSDKVHTKIDNEEFYMEAGNIYNFNNTLMHAVYNKSDEDRVHIIMDYQDEDTFDTIMKNYKKNYINDNITQT